MNAPNPSIERGAEAWSTPSEPPAFPIIVRNIRVPNIHSCSSRPRMPSGFSRLCSGPAPNPSSEIEKPATRTFVMTTLPSLSGLRIEADTRLFKSPSLPLDRAWRLACHVIDDAVDALDLVDDARCGPTEKGHVEGIEVRGHAVDRRHRAQRADRI